MFDTAACCRIRAASSSVVTVEALRELKALLRSTQQTSRELAKDGQHRYLLNAGGADVGVVEAAEVYSTGVICSTESETGLAGTVTRDSTEGSAIADNPAATAWSKVGHRSDVGGGVR